MSGRAAEFGFAAGWALIKALPRPVAWRLFRAGADRAVRRRGPGVQRLERNLRQVVGPELPEAEFRLLVRDGLRSYARYWLDAFRLPKLSPEQVRAGLVFHNGHLLHEAVDAGTGAVVALPHSGNWDHAGAWVCAEGMALTTVAERLKPERLYQRFVDYRESLGMEIIPASGGGQAPVDVLADRLRAARVVPLLADRDLSARGVEVTFFGGRTRMPAGPALLTLRTGAPLFVATLWYEGDTPHVRLAGPVAVPDPGTGALDARVRALTQTMADELAAGIAQHPVDWHMLQKLWLADVAPASRAGSGAPGTGVPATSPAEAPAAPVEHPG